MLRTRKAVFNRVWKLIWNLGFVLLYRALWWVEIETRATSSTNQLRKQNFATWSRDFSHAWRRFRAFDKLSSQFPLVYFFVVIWCCYCFGLALWQSTENRPDSWFYLRLLTRDLKSPGVHETNFDRGVPLILIGALDLCDTELSGRWSINTFAYLPSRLRTPSIVTKRAEPT